MVHHKEGSFDVVGFLVHGRYLWPCIQSLEKFKERVRVLTRRQQPKNVRQVIRDLNLALRGFGNYFRVADVKGLFEDLDGWIRMRRGCFIEKKKAVKHQNYRISHSVLAWLGLVSLSSLKAQSLLLPATGQPYRKAVDGKSVRTV